MVDIDAIDGSVTRSELNRVRGSQGEIELIVVSECPHGDGAAELFGQDWSTLACRARVKTTVMSRTEDALAGMRRIAVVGSAVDLFGTNPVLLTACRVNPTDSVSQAVPARRDLRRALKRAAGQQEGLPGLRC
jgi:hypothetical protein